MNVGDIVKYSVSAWGEDYSDSYGSGLVIDFVDSEISNNFPWIKIYWGSWNSITQGPKTDFELLNENR